MLPFTFFTRNSNEPEKRVELNLKGSAQSCEKDLAVVSGSYFNTNTGLFRRAEGVPGSDRLREKLQHQSDRKTRRRLMWARRGMASHSSCFMTQNNTKWFLGAMCKGAARPCFSSAAYFTTHLQKRGADLFCGSILPQHTTPKEHFNMRDEASTVFFR